MWCTNVLTVVGVESDLDRFATDMRLVVMDQKGEPVTVPLLFEALLSRPKDLDIEESSIGHRGYQALYGDWEALLEYPVIKAIGVTDRPSLIRYLEQRDERHFTLAQRYRLNECKHGFRTWYDWNLGHYGTKWDLNVSTVCEREPEKLTYRFDTVEHPPRPWFELAQASYPNLSMKLASRNPWKIAVARELPADRI